MAEFRRLIISDYRIKESYDKDNVIELLPDEVHYIARVMRYRVGDYLHIVDGKGCIWLSEIIPNYLIKLSTDCYHPLSSAQQPKPLTGLAVVVPKKGFEEIIRMSCELGVDMLQPLSSEHSISSEISDNRYKRYESIINESVEQSERLWKPKLKRLSSFQEWLTTYSVKYKIGIGTTRLEESVPIDKFLMDLSEDIECVWSLIGPEGGWSISEIKYANKKGCINVHLGKNILRTSTASLAATHSMMSWRNNLI